MSELILPVSGRDHVKGPRSAPVTLVEYGDYECPYCGQAYWCIKDLEETLGDLLCFAFRNLPLAYMHPHAEHAAEAVEASAAQGKFWEMHGSLFEHQEALHDRDLVDYAARIGLDVPLFIREMTLHRYAAQVRDDFLGGVRCGVTGTPTLFVNGVLYRGSLNLRSLLAAIEQMTDEE
jgi:protein-disulfide isomerase